MDIDRTMKKINMEKMVITYEEALTRLEELVGKMENNELNLDQLGNSLEEAQMLIKMCRDKLYQTEIQVNGIMKELE